MRPHPDKNMDMVGHAVNLEHFVLVFLENTRHILMQSFLPIAANKRRPVFNCENKLDMDLAVTIRHVQLN